MSESAQPQVITVSERDGITVLRVEASQLTNLQTVDHFAEQLVTLVSAGNSDDYIVDFGGVTFIVTPAVNALLQAKKQATARDGRLVVVGLNENIRRVFQLMTLDRVLLLEPDLDAAVAHLKG